MCTASFFQAKEKVQEKNKSQEKPKEEKVEEPKAWLIWPNRVEWTELQFLASWWCQKYCTDVGDCKLLTRWTLKMEIMNKKTLCGNEMEQKIVYSLGQVVKSPEIGGKKPVREWIAHFDRIYWKLGSVRIEGLLSLLCKSCCYWKIKAITGACFVKFNILMTICRESPSNVPSNLFPSNSCNLLELFVPLYSEKGTRVKREHL